MKTITLIQTNIHTTKTKVALSSIALIVVIATIMNIFFNVSNQAVEYAIKGPLFISFLIIIGITGPWLKVMAKDLPANDYEGKKNMNGIGAFFNTSVGMFMLGQVTLHVFDTSVSHFSLPFLSIPAYFIFCWLVGNIFYSPIVEKLLGIEINLNKKGYSEMQKELIKRYRRWSIMLLVSTALSISPAFLSLEKTDDNLPLLLSIGITSFVITFIYISLSSVGLIAMHNAIIESQNELRKAKKDLTKLLLSITVLEKTNIDTSSVILDSKRQEQYVLRVEKSIKKMEEQREEFKACEINSYLKYLFGKDLGEKIEKF